ncbi:hydrogenase expression/formation protein HypE [Heliophilum fasciatum]|uniref:Hydrogenase maturation carbamoyl dehydratase HypE n=1 Tax=Heliophilum fasciatum TaxID=35700 RepID=A0A4R2RFV9_9FIRM|nr:hydrogenase expression/formation protein HypE [Heliophilum fasciatum]MCW2278945.1 hydrogenase expression/formation protein HypE [Heliophilum fasciatum]TCP61803.1 hydrogenase maturation carbamoyl dehydratase HypE [Heliophilum fasciatum]
MKQEQVLLAHGDGGQLTHQLVQELFLRYFNFPALQALTDAALLPPPAGRLAVTTDSFVVQPLFFPGGDIGTLAVAGTVNDLAVSGAKPMYLTAGFILEEGLLLVDLERVVASMAETARDAGVAIVAGDTKVVERGRGDGLYINTAGIGVVLPDLDGEGASLDGSRIGEGDAVLISGTLGDHGLTIMAQRAGIAFDTPVQSDCAPLSSLIAALQENCLGQVKWMRDPTRGGVATTLKEIAEVTAKDIVIDEQALPVRDAVADGAAILGLDPLYLANEGKVLVIVAPEARDAALAALQAHPLGREAACIGHVSGGSGQVYLKTPLGGHRILNRLMGESLPRIC